MLGELLRWLADREAEGHAAGRPRVTLSYAQSLDGSLSAARGQPLALSGPESLRMTHELRARHDAILVGIGTVLADNPRLNVRFASGPDPRPVVLDTHLRLPDECALMNRQVNLPWVTTGIPADPARKNALEARGAQVLEITRDETGRVDLSALLGCLFDLGIRSVMVEGGAAVISAFLRQRLVDQAVITIAPVFVSGFNLAGALLLDENRQAPALIDPVFRQFGRDVVAWGKIKDQII